MRQKGVVIGNKYNFLTVINQAEYKIDAKGRKVKQFLCLCDCGNKVVVRSNNILSGNTTSCGCHSSRITHKKEDLSGQRFGRLVVIKREDSDKTSKFLCKCDCGNSCVVNISCLKNGHTQSCGCLQKEKAVESNLIDLTGKRFGKLVVLKRISDVNLRPNPRQTYYECLCDCGMKKIVNAYYLTTGTTKSCGCLHSIGERLVEDEFEKRNIRYVRQYTFEDLLGPKNGKLMFDFCIFDDSNKPCLIEYQGIQHYLNTEFGKYQREVSDILKKEYCKQNGYKLFEIKYNDNIEESIKNILNAIHVNTVPSSE